MPSITVEFRPHVELHYRILTRLDLGDDDANLFRSTKAIPPWAGTLSAAYREASTPLVVHVLPLLANDLEHQLQLLEPGRLEGLSDPGGRRLAQCLAEILRQEGADPIVHQPPAPGEIRWLQTLMQCRKHLWSRLDAACPPLRIIDVPSLAAGEFTHGRATGTTEERVVAVSLSVGEPAFVQILHEEIHPVTDPVVRQQVAAAGRDTAVGSRGYRVHRQLERTAIEVGRALVDARAPRFSPIYRRWEQRFY